MRSASPVHPATVYPTNLAHAQQLLGKEEESVPASLTCSTSLSKKGMFPKWPH